MAELNAVLSSQGQLTATLAATGSLTGRLSLALDPYQHPATHDYVTEITNKPQLNSVELVGNKSFAELGLVELSNLELEALLS